MSRIQLGAVIMAPALLLAACDGRALAVAVNSPSALHPSSTLIDFESFAVGTAEPIMASGATITTYDREGSLAPRTVAAPNANQTAHPGIFSGNYFGPGRQHFLIEFDSPVSQFGVGVHDANFDDNEILAFDALGNLLESAVSAAGSSIFPTGPSGGSHSSFVGFVRPTAEISYVELHHVFNPAAGKSDLWAIDNVMFFAGGGAGVVPEPSSFALLGIIAGVLGMFAWRKRQS